MNEENNLRMRRFYPNGYGVSIIHRFGSYGYAAGLFEVAVLQGTEDDYDLCYNTPITGDVIGHQDFQEVANILEQVQALPSCVREV
jgi:hypothetical protein